MAVYSGNPYYNSKSAGGYNPCVIGNIPKGASSRTGAPGCNVLPNCVGYAWGRFHEFMGNKSFKYWVNGNANTIYGNTSKLKKGKDPQVGAIICWSYGGGGPGHVAFVESVSGDTITISESGWSGDTYQKYPYYATHTIKKKNGTWPVSWSGSNAVFQGFIYNPSHEPSEEYFKTETTGGQQYTGGAYTEQEVQKIVYETQTKTVTYQGTKTAEYDGVLNKTKSTSLLSYPSLVESPFVIVDIGGYRFGTYSKTDYGNKYNIEYPNYINSMNVTKINGSVNQYTINMIYQIRANDDPNIIDKILSSVGYGIIKISYGDWQSPTFIYKEEEALITNVTSNVDFANSRISYTIKCTSTAVGLYSQAVSFNKVTKKPSAVIHDVFFNSQYGLQSVFPGITKDNFYDLVASDDKAVEIPAKNGIDPLSYINYLVTCMISQTNGDEKVLLDSSYYLTIHDDIYGNDTGGQYFKVTKISSNTKTLSNFDTYEVDIGYPSENMVTEFNITNDQSWALLYNYNGELNKQDYVYNIDNEGKVVVEYSPNISTSNTSNSTTAAQKTWWTNMTAFPIQATLQIKGLVRPAMLMSYIRINAMFYGQRHISSGLYFVTKQEDKIDSRGYRTILSLTRFASDDDYITELTKQVTYKVPVVQKK